MTLRLSDRANRMGRISGRTRLREICASLLLGFCALGAYAQSPTTAQAPLSELARQNLERVAASGAQIEKVLHKDAGLMVELKRWVAKDATDHGQLISDTDLTDQAIYDRLASDVQFRSVATALLRKYGYLLPQVNPDSPQGKEQELLIQNRAKWVAQEQEEWLAQVRQRRAREMERARSCDPREEPDCSAAKPTLPAEEAPQRLSTPAPRQNSVPPGSPLAPGLPPDTATLLQQAQMSSPQAEMAAEEEGSLLRNPSGLAASPQSNSGPGTLISSPSTANGSLASSSQIALRGAPERGGVSDPSLMNGLIYGYGSQEESPGYFEAAAGGSPLGGEINAGASELASNGASRLNFPRMRAKSPLSQRMVRRPLPYAAIPSLYDMYLQASPKPPAPERFGIEVFEYGSAPSQLIPFDLPAGPDYVVGPGDGLTFSLWGGISRRLFRTVDREGRVSLPEVGPVLVAGKSLADVQKSVQETLHTEFRDISADVSLSRLRTIRVYVVGDVAHPGAYDISSLSTPLNALFAAGGPTNQGSLRITSHKRGIQLVENVDVYDLLLHGVRTNLQRLENGDTVLIPPIGAQVTIEGMVRRPAIYELRDEKSLSDLLTLAGGLLPTATLRHIEVQRVVAHEKRTMLSLDVPPDADPAAAAQQLDAFQVQDGDQVRVFPIAPYNQNVLYLEGHVLRPGKYSYRPGMRVTDLISSYTDLLPEPANQYGEIIRLNAPDYRPTVESFNLEDALSHPGSAPLLQPLDTVQVFGRYDFEDPPTVSVWGDVRVPGTYQTSGQLHLSDAIHMAGGLAPNAEKEDAQVFRYLPDGQLKIFSVKLGEALSGNPAENIVLNSRDRILIHRSPADVDPATVYIQGEVARPGRYPMTTNMTVADLLRAAGGAKQSADLKNADLTRYEWNSQSQMTGQHQEIPLAQAMSGNADANVPVHNGDVLTIRKLPGWDDLGATIVVRGEVAHPGTYGIRPGERLSSILKRAGGFMSDAYPYGAVLTRPEVQEMEDRSQTELVERVHGQQASLKLAAKTENDPDTKLADEAAYHQWESTLESLMNDRPVGRMVILISSNFKSWEGTSRDIAVRAGDRLIIPKKPSFVMVQGQVYSPTAVSFQPGKSANWYLSQAGGPTNIANKKAIFVIRANGSVIGSHGSSLFSGSALEQSLEPGDMVVVPEKALGGPPRWKGIFERIQAASAVTTAAIFAARY